MRTSIFYFFIVLLQLTLFSCKNKTIYTNQLEPVENTWTWSDTMANSVYIKDSTKAYNIFFTVNLNEDYPYANLYLFVHTYFPDNHILKDTVNCKLADNYGKWYGKKRFGTIKNKLAYRVNVRFPRNGNYNIVIEQGMRKENLKGIESVGLQIEEFN